ncbi:MAG: hypothetical protein HND48_16230 [Chloroflexi bacterium]|nr:hypothetical protein [Chloroflexota bacterium]
MTSTGTGAWSWCCPIRSAAIWPACAATAPEDIEVAWIVPVDGMVSTNLAALTLADGHLALAVGTDSGLAAHLAADRVIRASAGGFRPDF